MPDDKPEELSLQAKQAVRDYLEKLLALPVINVSAISFFLGFIIREGAMDKALTEASEKTMATLKEINQQSVKPVIEATVSAAEAKRQAEEAAAFVQKSKADIAEITKTLSNLSDLKQTLAVQGNSAKQVAATIMDDPNFRKQIVTQDDFHAALAEKVSIKRSYQITTFKGDWAACIGTPKGDPSQGAPLVLTAWGDTGPFAYWKIVEVPKQYNADPDR